MYRNRAEREGCQLCVRRVRARNEDNRAARPDDDAVRPERPAATALWPPAPTPEQERRRAGFVRIPLDMTNPSGLAVLAVIVTATPGTAWIEYEPRNGQLLLHVFDLIEGDDWVHTIKSRYESLLMEIFE